MRALHLASFNGNVGDHINHVGFWRLFKENVFSTVEVTELEIREFYKSWGLRVFDQEFVEYVNTFDLFVIGGGNFFDIKWEYSSTGTTIDISLELLKQIRIPIVFNGMGVDVSENTSNNEIEKFRRFISFCNDNDRIVVSVRNDGSKEILERLFPKEDIDSVIEIPDGGFFTFSESYYHPELKRGAINVAINVAKDSINTRWPCSNYTYDSFCLEMAKFLEKSVGEIGNIHFVFVSHIPSDIDAISDILNKTKDIICRNNISVAPYLNGSETNGDYIIDLYRKVNSSIAMRYHANICSIAMGTPTIGIVTFPKHRELYQKIGLKKRLFDVSNGSFFNELFNKLVSTLENRRYMCEENINLISSFEKSVIQYSTKIKEVIENSQKRN